MDGRPDARARVRLPEGEEVRDLLTQLVGRTVTLRSTGAPRPNAGPQAECTYVEPDGTVRAIASLDLELGAALGAALGLLPGPMVTEATRTGALSPPLLECLHEVVNVCARLLNRPGGAFVTLGQLPPPPDTLPEAVKTRMARASLQREYELEVAGYPRGRMVIRVD